MTPASASCRPRRCGAARAGPPMPPPMRRGEALRRRSWSAPTPVERLRRAAASRSEADQAKCNRAPSDRPWRPTPAASPRRGLIPGCGGLVPIGSAVTLANHPALAVKVLEHRHHCRVRGFARARRSRTSRTRNDSIRQNVHHRGLKPSQPFIARTSLGEPDQWSVEYRRKPTCRAGPSRGDVARRLGSA